jgi:hypothetical protein
LFLDDDGFLADPEGRLGSFLNPDALPFETVSGYRCAVLLGEPGIGKTTELERVNQQGLSAPANTEVLALDLKDYSSEALLAQDLFCDSKIRHWADGSHELLLSLDSLDECMLRVEAVANLLSSRLGRYPFGRLWLRIACRTAVWPESLEQTLKKLWPTQFGIFELLPLRRKDVETAAEAFGVQPESFVREVISRQAVPFAIKPLTLRFLLEQYRREGRLPNQIAPIYLEGCRSLCIESNRSRHETRREGNLSADQRLAVAGRLAALTLFTGRTEISQRDTPTDQHEESVLSIREALGGSESENGQVVEITLDAIRETLDTGLFSARGAGRLGWAHQTYGEFLAARYLTSHALDTEQKLSLITHSGHSSRLVVPQLTQTAVCLATIDPSLFDELLEDNPHVLLRSAGSGWNDIQKSVLTASLLKLIAESKVTDREASEWKGLSNLNHPDLASQLESHIRDRTANLTVRRVAIRIAEACHVTRLQGTLLEIALDRSDHQPTRVQAIRALREVGDNAIRQQLATLLATDLKEDDDDQIRGALLSQAWPELFSLQELTQYLTEPKESSFLGAYWSFLSNEFAQKLSPADLPQALAWVNERDGNYDMLSFFDKAADNIVKLACRNVEDPTICVPLSAVIAARLENEHSLWKQDLFGDPEDNPLREVKKRHLLIQVLVQRSPDAEALSRLKVIRNLQEDDFSWILQQALNAPTEEIEKWILLVQECLSIDVDRYWAPILDALYGKSLAEHFTYWFGPILLGSPMADWQRREWQHSKKISKLEAVEEVIPDTLRQQVDLVLQETGVGAIETWGRLAELLANWQRREYNADIRKYRLWDQLDDKRRSKVIQAAQRYILEGESPEDCTMSRRFSIDELAGFQALYLVSSEAQDFREQLDPSVIARWTPLILKKPGLVDREAKPYEALLHLASQHAPDLVAQKIAQAIDEQNREADNNDRPNLDAQLQACWTGTIEGLLVNKLKSGGLKPGFTVYLLDVLLARNSGPAQQWALQLLKESIPSEEVDQETQLRVALRLLFIAGDAWSSVWSRITALAALQESWTEQAVSHLYDEFEQGRLTTLEGSRLGEICAWLQQAFPEIPRARAGVTSGGYGMAEVLRGQLFNYLQKAGTPNALQALERLARLQPDAPGPKWMLAEAQQAALRHTWNPPAPEEILKMASRPNTRIVGSGEQLLEVILESLERFQQKLHAQTPLVDFLWNRWPNEKGENLWRPKDEEDLSNFVKSHLEEDLVRKEIILNREVEIRRSRGKEIREGQETDILVDAINRHPRSGESQRISVIIEVKGCWNIKDLKLGMREQLVGRYLAESTCRHGLYLVGWFLCDAWDKEDYRKGQTPKWPLQEAREYFREQAVELSRGDLSIRALVLDAALR